MSALAKQLAIKLPFLKINFRISILLAFLLLLVLSMFVALFMGAIDINFSALINGTIEEQQKDILYSIRLPRVLLGAIVGAALAVSGAAMQGLFRNPLADPSLVGVTSGAALAVGIVIVFSGSMTGTFGLYGMSIAAFLGGLTTCLLIFRFASMTGNLSVTYMLLAGIAINALAMAGTGFLSYISNDQQLRMFTFWTMGSVGGAMWPAVIVGSSLIIPCIFYLIKNSRELNIFMLGEEEAEHLGVDSKSLKRKIIFLTAIAIGVAVSLSGIIVFLGLIVPHLVRLITGADNRILVPASALLGATLLVVADTLARTIFAPAEMPVGIITSMIGGPFFLFMLAKQRWVI